MFKIYTAARRFKSVYEGITAHSLFSFQSHFDASNVAYGRLIAFNDYLLDAGTVFPRHPHENKDQVFLVLEGSLCTDDNLGNADTLSFGDMQYIIAGDGYSREARSSGPGRARYLGIWLDTVCKNTPPAYGISHFAEKDLADRWCCVVSKEDGAITSVTEVFIGHFNDQSPVHTLNPQSRYLLYVCQGQCRLGQGVLQQGDHVRIEGEKEVRLHDCQEALVLLLSDI